jgi:predicted lipoprotein with Yx(FWY)xxD motif
MYFSKIAFSLGLLATAASAAPSSFQQRSSVVTREIIDYGISPLSAGDLEKREIIDLGFTSDSTDDLEKRGSSNYVSSCGKNWMPIADDKSKSHSGYRSAVEQYCYHITHSQDGLPTVIGHGQKHAVIVKGGYYLKGDIPAAVNCKYPD